ncbi:MAG: AgmX/PglI C-terminal domain-containing protein [Kofleriaceae bacterium]|nr:AgmX/PglI C-terminal domain-containing protein [Myxococcales bacterium]MCB9560174.1 AgmX/PglI C-terminal domain-containing protein [Kofleriaceae bacterium]MCB9571264.1 AgmX/PglI C-terminal domain-containing protein [Kofleriaceae bacterium]
MRATSIACVLAAAALVASSGRAAADPVSFASGGPGGAAADDAVAALGQVRALMAVCWQRQPPSEVQVAIAVDKHGVVTSATAKTKGGAAQCAAGILAVSTLAPTRKAWKGVVAIRSASADQGADARAIQAQLASRYQDALFGCQDRAPDFAGKLSVRLTVQHDGSVSAAEVPTAGVARAMARCLVDAARAFRFDELSSESVTYEVGLAFAGAAAGKGKGKHAGGVAGGVAGVSHDDALRPTRKGPIDADAARDVVRGALPAVVACAKKRKPTGVATFRLAIAASGKVKEAKVKTSELGDATVEACVVKALGALTFPSASGDSVVIYPIGFDGASIRTGD